MATRMRFYIFKIMLVFPIFLKKIKTINTLEDKVFAITKEIDVEFQKISLQIKKLGGHDITKE